LARSNAGRNTSGRRAGGSRRAAPPQATSPDLAASRTPTLASTALPRVWQGIGYRPLPDLAPARPLFDFAAVPWPDSSDFAFAWGAWAPARDGEQLVGVLIAERSVTTALVHVLVRGEDQPDPLEIAAQLVLAAIDHAGALGVKTIYARPQGLDRVWIRFGFIPVPEVALPAALAGRAGVGLYAWRGNSALWTLREAADD
jgi:hypothetical protein